MTRRSWRRGWSRRAGPGCSRLVGLQGWWHRAGRRPGQGTFLAPRLETFTGRVAAEAQIPALLNAYGIVPVQVPTAENCADILTKILGRIRFWELLGLMNIFNDETDQ